MVQVLIIVALVAITGMMIYAYKKITESMNAIKDGQDRIKDMLLDNFGEFRDALSAIKIDLATIAGKIVVANDKIDKFTDQQNVIKEFFAGYLEGLRSYICELSRKADDYNKENKDSITKAVKNILSAIEFVRDEFAPTVDEAKAFFDAQNKRYQEMLEHESVKRGIRFARYQMIMQMREEGHPISKIAQMLTEKWGYKVTSNDVNEIIKNVGEEYNAHIIANSDMPELVKTGEGLVDELNHTSEEPVDEKDEIVNQADERIENIQLCIGAVYCKDGESYEVVECQTKDVSDMCDCCSLGDECGLEFKCFAAERTDGKNVMFKLVEKGTVNVIGKRLPVNYGEPKTDMGCDCGSKTCECCAHVVDPEEQVEDGKSK